MSKNERKYPKGYWTSVAIGSGIGASLERMNKDNIRPLTEQERARQKRGVIAGLIVTFLALIGVLILFLQGK